MAEPTTWSSPTSSRIRNIWRSRTCAASSSSGRRTTKAGIRQRARRAERGVSMKRVLLTLFLVLAIHAPAWATWSVIAVDKKTGQVIVASATCVAQAGFPKRQPLPSRDLMDVQAVIVPGVGVAACQAGADNTRRNQMTVFDELKKGTDPAKIIEIL